MENDSEKKPRLLRRSALDFCALGYLSAGQPALGEEHPGWFEGGGPVSEGIRERYEPEPERPAFVVKSATPIVEPAFYQLRSGEVVLTRKPPPGSVKLVASDEAPGSDETHEFRCTPESWAKSLEAARQVHEHANRNHHSGMVTMESIKRS